ncbi:MAG: SUMF1/EgtB/PvdO family nonheme iron enzyme [Candidatus Eremiobacteraeota bacterium]|nr:SUMF1/EgtB/PvdO family nonheme iron enzyme [Candidatus Eremiobacteraeota bacterium]
MITSPGLDRARLVEWFRRNRERSASIFALVNEDAFHERPIPLRHPLAFYEGHLPAFNFLTLNERGLGEPPLDSRLERLFERGIDPSSADAARSHDRSDWPARETVQRFGARCDSEVERALMTARIDDPSVPSLVRAQAAYTILEHEPMHHETLLYLIHQLPYGRKRALNGHHDDHPVGSADFKTVPAGIATLGADSAEAIFGWDNEFERTEIAVDEFHIAERPVTNGDWQRFLAQGGPVPPFWHRRNGEWHLKLVFEEIPLPRSWPAYVSHDQAEAYAAWAGMRLPSEAEYHRAAFGTPEGAERPFPWGDEAPSAAHGNFDFERFDPEPVDAHPLGRSAWGVLDLVGNGWEWTSTPFGPLPGFTPMTSYPVYSSDFFDGKHYVMKGASPATSRDLIRRSFRNWFYGDYPYMYAKFRCVTK